MSGAAIRALSDGSTHGAAMPVALPRSVVRPSLGAPSVVVENGHDNTRRILLDLLTSSRRSNDLRARGEEPPDYCTPGALEIIYDDGVGDGAKSGGHLWADVVRNDEPYYIGRREPKLASAVAPILRKIVDENAEGLQIVSTLSLGPGDGFAAMNKEAPFLEAFLPEVAVAADINPDYLHSFESVIRMELSRRVPRVALVRGDFSEVEILRQCTSKLSQVQSVGLTLIDTFGCTVDQFPDKARGDGAATLSDLFTRLYDAVDGKGLLFLTADSVADGDRAAGAYRGSYMQKFMQNFWSVARRHVDGGLDPTKFVYVPQWNEKRYRVEHGFIARADQHPVICGQDLFIKGGDTIVIGYSYKQPNGTVSKVAKKCGWEPVATFTGDSPVRGRAFRGDRTLWKKGYEAQEFSL